MKMPITAVSRFEKIDDIVPATQNTSYNLPSQGGNLPMDRFIHTLRLEVAMRITMPGVNPPTAINADAPYSLIDNVTVEGTHRIRGAREVFIDLRGAELAQLNRLYTSHAYLNTPNPLSIVAAATNDLRFIVDIPFVPLKMPPWKQIEWLLDAPNYQNLKLTIKWADPANLFTLAAGTVTFTAFGSAAGNPNIAVSGKFAQFGPSLARGFVPGRVWRQSQEVSGSDLTTTATAHRLFNLPLGQRLRSLLIKTGVKATTTAGNNAFLTLSDTILANIRVDRGQNKMNRLYSNMYNLQEESGEAYAIRPQSGYGLIDWADHGLEEELFDLRALTSGPTGEVDTFLKADVTGAASQALVVVTEEWRGQPQMYK